MNNVQQMVLNIILMNTSEKLTLQKITLNIGMR